MATSPVSKTGPLFTPSTIAAGNGLLATGIIPAQPAACTIVTFDPAGTGGVGSGNLRINANAGEGMPAFNLQLNPGDGTALHTFIRAEVSATTGRNHIHLPEDLDVDGTLFLAAGGAQISGDASGSLVLESAVPGAILLNWFSGGRVVFGDGATGTQVGQVDSAGNATFNGILTAKDGEFQTCKVGGSPVVTVATLPPSSMVYPGVGIGVSTGSAWGASINPATLQGKLTLTTTGNSGAATLVGNTLNIPQYAGAVQVYPAAGLAVSTGSAWGASIDPATLVRTDVANTFTAAQTVTGDLSASGKLSGGGIHAYVSNAVDGLMPDALTIRSLPGGTGTTINAPHTAGLYLNWDSGGSLIFGGGNGGEVGVMDAGGNLSIASLQCISFQGAGTQVALIDYLGNASFAGTLHVTGATTLASLAVTGSATVGGSPVVTVATLPPSSMVYPGAGVPVSTGSAWGTSIAANNIALLNANNTFTANQVFGSFNATSAVFSGSVNTGNLTVTQPLFQAVNGTFTGTLNVSGAATLSNNLNLTGGINLSTGGAQIFGDSSGSISINSKTPGGLLLNWGSGGLVRFGNGAGAPVGSVDSAGNATFNGALLGGGLNIKQVATALPAAAGGAAIRIGPTGTFILNTYSTGGLYFNWDSGTGGVNFGNGSGVSVGTIDNAGNATFSGFVKAGPMAIGANTAFTGGNPPNLNSDGTWITVNPNGAAALYLNRTGGTGGVIFNNGAGGSVGSIDSVGNFNTNGGIHCVGAMTADAGYYTSGPKAFRIPHPLDDKKQLTHACLEGPENGVFYRGEVKTKNGSAEVELPDYFEALTRRESRSVLLTQIMDKDNEEFAMMMVSRVVDGKFRIRTNPPNVKVAWEVKAVRADLAALEIIRNRIEEQRPPEQKPISKKRTA